MVADVEPDRTPLIDDGDIFCQRRRNVEEISTYDDLYLQIYRHFEERNRQRMQDSCLAHELTTERPFIIFKYGTSKVEAWR